MYGYSLLWLVCLKSTVIIWAQNTRLLSQCCNVKQLFKVILWDRRWSPPSIRISPQTCWLQKCIYNHETKQASKFQSDQSSNCFTIDVWKINCWIQQFISYFLIGFFLYLILHKFCSVLTYDILGIGLL